MEVLQTPKGSKRPIIQFTLEYQYDETTIRKVYLVLRKTSVSKDFLNSLQDTKVLSILAFACWNDVTHSKDDLIGNLPKVYCYVVMYLTRLMMLSRCIRM